MGTGKKWYILNNFLALLPRLIGEGVVAKKQRIRAPEERTGVCFPEEYLEKVASIAGVKVLGETKTDVKNVFFLKTNFVFGEVKIQKNEATERTRPILEEYAAAFRTNIFLHGTHANSQLPIEDEWLHIFPYCAPEISDGKKINHVFGIELPGGTRDAVKANSGKWSGIPLKDSNGIIFGEIVGKEGRNVYIHFDLTHLWDTVTDTLMKKVLDQYFSIVSDKKVFQETMAEIERKRAEVERKKEAEAKDNYIRFVSGRLKSSANEIVKRVDDTKNLIADLSKQLTETCRVHDQLSERLEELSGDRNLMEEFAQEYDRLLGDKNVEKVLAHGDCVEVFTKHLVLNGRDIGKFKITMHLDGKYACENLTQIIKECHHPHVRSPHDCCFGVSKEDIYKLVKKFQFEIAFHKIWSRLNLYSKENPYANLENWPKAERRK